ncbi:MAG: hypothetical protein QM811_14755 [Pirellulales bacterium]
MPKEVVVVRLKNATKYTRVHVFATRYYPEYDAFRSLVAGADLEPFYGTRIPAESVYLTGRNIGDEYRYIIDRRYAHKFPGNMLNRPSLLLNPWAIRETETGEQIAQGGDEFARANKTPKRSAAVRGARCRRRKCPPRRARTVRVA